MSVLHIHHQRRYEIARIMRDTLEAKDHSSWSKKDWKTFKQVTTGAFLSVEIHDFFKNTNNPFLYRPVGLSAKMRTKKPVRKTRPIYLLLHFVCDESKDSDRIDIMRI